MPQIKIWAAAVSVGLVAILLLGKLSMLEDGMQTLRQDIAVAAHPGRLELTDDNLPDAVVSLHLHLRVTRVGWDHRMLMIDLLLPQGERGPAAVWQDLASIIRFSFGDAGNVCQTLVRVYRAADNGGRTLMFYCDPRREDWSDGIAALQAPERGSGEDFRQRIGLSATPAGNRWLANV